MVGIAVYSKANLRILLAEDSKWSLPNVIAMEAELDVVRVAVEAAKNGPSLVVGRCNNRPNFYEN